MKRCFISFFAIAVCTCLLLVGCAPQTPNPVPVMDEQTGALGTTMPTITVTGESELSAAPDMATLQLGIAVNEKATAEEALQTASEIMEAVASALRALGLEAQDLQTSNFQLFTQYSYDENGNRVGNPKYNVSNILIITVNNIDIIGQIIDVAAASGANTVHDLSFGLHDSQALEAEALKAAMEDAKKRATILAEASGKKVGDVILLNDGTQMAEQVLQTEMIARSASTMNDMVGGSYISAGVLKIQAKVSARFILQ